MSLIRRVHGAVFSRGHGFEPHQPGKRFSLTGVEGYFVDYEPKISSAARHPNAPVHPADLAQLALGWFERILASDDAAAEEEFFALCGRLRRRATSTDDDALLWPYDVDLPKFRVRAPWFSALAQGQIASVYVRAWQRSGDARYADDAQRALRPLLRPTAAGLVTLTADGPVLEEVGPGRPPSQILNGWIFALWGVRDVAVGIGAADAVRAFYDGTSCLIDRLPRYDTGWWTRYSLLPNRIPDLAKPFYHRLHVTQLDVLYTLTGRTELRDTAERWRSYDRPLAVAAALASKGPFVMANRARLAAPRRS